jgi:hypothetical protein
LESPGFTSARSCEVESVCTVSLYRKPFCVYSFWHEYCLGNVGCGCAAVAEMAVRANKSREACTAAVILRVASQRCLLRKNLPQKLDWIY